MEDNERTSSGKHLDWWLSNDPTKLRRLLEVHADSTKLRRLPEGHARSAQGVGSANVMACARAPAGIPWHVCNLKNSVLVFPNLTAAAQLCCCSRLYFCLVWCASAWLKDHTQPVRCTSPPFARLIRGCSQVLHPLLFCLLGSRGSKVQLMLQLGEGLRFHNGLF